MGTISYKVSDLKKLIQESNANEFKPKLGPNVERDDKKNSQEAYKTAEKRAKDYDGGLKEPKKQKLEPRQDGNKTGLGISYDAEPGDDFKKRVAAQAQGYTSELEKKNGIEKSGEFNDDFYENEKETVKQMTKDMENVKTAGLVSHNLAQNDKEYGKIHNVFNEARKPMKRLVYHHTNFVNESQIFAKIPEDFKVDGNRFLVKDASENEYLVEWCIDTKNNISAGKILNERNLKEADKSIDRMAELMNYNSGSIYGRGNSKSVVNEEKNIGDMLDNIRKITD